MSCGISRSGQNLKEPSILRIVLIGLFICLKCFNTVSAQDNEEPEITPSPKSNEREIKTEQTAKKERTKDQVEILRLDSEKPGGSKDSFVEQSGPTLIVSLSHEPDSPVPGQQVKLIVETVEEAMVEIDFGEGFSAVDSVQFSTFGLKSVQVRATIGEEISIAPFLIPVYGGASVTMSAESAPHNVLGTSTISAFVTGDGEYDQVKGYYRGQEVFASDRRDTYQLPVFSAGTFTFTAELFMGGYPVADLGEVSFEGVNEPPSKPFYDGDQILEVRVGEELRFEVFATDLNGDELLFEVSFAPEGSTFDPTNGLFTWTPESTQVGLHLVHFRAFDLPFMTKRSFAQRALIVEP